MPFKTFFFNRNFWKFHIFVYITEKEELIFLQLPDVLPGVPKGLQLGLSDGSTGTANKENRENDEVWLLLLVVFFFLFSFRR